MYDNKKSVTIVEIMGRHAGWLAAASALARKFEGDNPMLIYLPETAFDPERFLNDVTAAMEKTSNLVVCISEGINDGNGKFICELSGDVGVDTFGHKMLTGSGKYLENLVKERLGVKVRSIEAECMPEVFFRYAVRYRFKRGGSRGGIRSKMRSRRRDGKDDCFSPRAGGRVSDRIYHGGCEPDL